MISLMPFSHSTITKMNWLLNQDQDLLIKNPCAYQNVGFKQEPSGWQPWSNIRVWRKDWKIWRFKYPNLKIPQNCIESGIETHLHSWWFSCLRAQITKQTWSGWERDLVLRIYLCSASLMVPEKTVGWAWELEVQILASMSLSVPIPTVCQSEVHAIEICAREKLSRELTREKIFILSDSQASLKTLSACTFEWKLVWNCQ